MPCWLVAVGMVQTLSFSALATISTNTSLISCLLSSFTYTFPDLSFPAGVEDVTVKGLTCRQLMLSSISSQYLQPTSLFVQFKRLSTSCKGNYRYDGLSRNVRTDISSTLALTTAVEKQNNLPVAANLTSCSVQDLNVQVDFSSPVLNVFAPLVASIIESQVGGSVCPSLKPIFDEAASSLLINQLDPNIRLLINQQQPTLACSQNDSEVIDWSNSVYGYFYRFVQVLIARETLHSLSCFSLPSSVHSTFSLLVHEVMKSGEMFATQQFYGEQVQLSSAVSVRLQELRVRGFNTLTSFQLLEPSANCSSFLQSKWTFRSIEIEIDLVLIVDTSSVASSSCGLSNKPLTLTATWIHVDILVDFILAIEKGRVPSNPLDVFLSTNCWLGGVRQFAVANLLVKQEPQDLSVYPQSGPTSLDTDFIDLIDTSFLLFTSPVAFRNLSSQLITGALQGPIRKEINTVLDEKVQQWRSSYKDCHATTLWKDDVSTRKGGIATDAMLHSVFVNQPGSGRIDGHESEDDQLAMHTVMIAFIGYFIVLAFTAIVYHKYLKVATTP